MFHHMFFTNITTQQHLNFFIAMFTATRCAYNSRIEDEFEDDESANQQETEENNFLIGSQNIIDSLREQQQQPKKR